MKYLSIDLEATGLKENDLIIEFAAVPFDTESENIELNHSFHSLVKCPSFEELKPSLDQWVIEHNESLITNAHNNGPELKSFQKLLEDYLSSGPIQNYFGGEKIVLFGKSLSAIDLPFLNRDLGWDFMRKYFHHQQLDLSSVVYSFIDLNKIPQECRSGSFLMNHLGFGEVAHTALEDAINTAKIYLALKSKV